jgi:hypothetical protein
MRRSRVCKEIASFGWLGPVAYSRTRRAVAQTSGPLGTFCFLACSLSTADNHCFSRCHPCLPSGKGYAPFKLRVYRSVFRPGMYVCSHGAGQQLQFTTSAAPCDTLVRGRFECGARFRFGAYFNPTTLPTASYFRFAFRRYLKLLVQVPSIT